MHNSIIICNNDNDNNEIKHCTWMNVMTDVIHACGYVRVIMYACGWYTCVCVCVCMHVVYVQEYMCGIRAGIHVWYTCRNT